MSCFKNEENKPTDDFLNLVDDMEEVKYNVKKAMVKVPAYFP